MDKTETQDSYQHFYDLGLNPGERGRICVPAFTVAHLDVPHRQPAEERLPQLQVITIITITITITIIFLVKKRDCN